MFCIVTVFQFQYCTMALHFHIYTLLNEEDVFALLVWLFELSPSKITYVDGMATVPATIESLNVYAACTEIQQYRYSAPHVIGTHLAILIRRMPFQRDHSAYHLMRKMAGNHPIDGEWVSFKRGWKFNTGLGYRETGLTVPMSNSGIKFQTNRSGLGYTGGRYRHKDSPIKFISSKSTQYDFADID